MDYKDHRAGFVFSDIARFRARLFDRMLAPHGLTTSQAWVLAHLFVEDNLPQKEIARRMDIGTVTVGGLVERLEARGLVERHIDEEDRRIRRVVLKAEAKPIGRIMTACGIQVNETAFAGLNEDVSQQLMDNLLVIRKSLLEALEQDNNIKNSTDIVLQKGL
ncbi:MAG: winged helix-turn-helix transcriptional regulator [Sneathiella sp.]|nr:winged helix-turn-helix transcriptional regulator [Sneathiella sp.]